MFLTRSRIIASFRRQLEARDFFEVAAPATGSADELTRLVTKLAGAGASGFEADLAPAALAKAPDRAAAYLLLGRLAYDVAEPR